MNIALPFLPLLAAHVLAPGARSASALAEPQLPPARASLRIEGGANLQQWALVVTNEGSSPLRLLADGRRLRLLLRPQQPASDAAVAKSKKTKGPVEVECKLPNAMQSGGDATSRSLVLGPGEHYRETFQPDLYCFSVLQADALRAASEVVAKLGFEPAKGRAKHTTSAPVPPFVAVSSNGDAASIKELESAPFAPPSRASWGPTETPTSSASSTSAGGASPAAPAQNPASPASAQGRVEGASSAEDAPFDVHSSPRVDAPTPSRIDLSAWITNRANHPIEARLRTDSVVFEVRGPSGTWKCGSPQPLRALAPDFFSSIRPGQSQRVDVWLSEICPDHAFDKPGLYWVQASAKLFGGGESSGGARFQGDGASKDVTLVRLQTGPSPFYTLPPAASHE